MPEILSANPPQLRLRQAGSGAELALDGIRLIIAGYTGRDPAAVAAHLAELAAIGVPPPATVPAFFPLSPALLTTDPVVEVVGDATSGEAEPVLIQHRGRYYLGIGSDHTDRELERADIAGSKAACAKPLGAEVIALPADLDTMDWDAIELECTVDDTRYQRGTLLALRRPGDLLARLAQLVGDDHGDLVVFAGTLPLLDGKFVCGQRWQLKLTTPDGSSIHHSYEVKRRGA